MKRSGLGFAGLLVLAGCGGGGTSSAGGGEVSREDNFGAVTTRSTGTVNEPVIMGSRQAVVTGIYGASFNEITVRLPTYNGLNAAEVLANTSIAYNAGGTPKILDYGTGMISNLEIDEPPYGNSSMPTLSSNRIVYQKFIPSRGFQFINSFYDGSDRRQLTNTAVPERRWPVMSPDGRWLAFTQYDTPTGRYRLFAMPALGGTPVALSNTTDNTDHPTFSPDSTKVAFARQPLGTGSWTVSTVGINGAGQTDVGPTVTSWYGLAWSPGGQNIYGTFLNGSNYVIWNTVIGVNGGAIFSTPDPLGRISVAPTGDRFVVSRGGSRPGLYIVGANNLEYGQLVAGANAPSWGPPATERRMVGASASMGATTTGFAFGQVGSKVTGFLTFDAVTPSTLLLTPQANPNPNQANVVCTIRGDQLNNLKFVNDQRGGVVTIISAATSSTWATGAVVSFEADTGRVASVIPWKEAPAVTRSGDELTYKGAFLGVWDGTGKNIAQGGASAVTLDSRTGNLLTHR